MRRLGLTLLKLTAFGAAVAGVWLLTAPIAEDVVSVIESLAGAAALAVGIGLYALARWCDRGPWPVWTHEGTLDWTPEPNEGWRPESDWERFPDPLPEHPLPRRQPAPKMPHGPVPPDELLRRLWLVRAHLVSYRARVRNRNAGMGCAESTRVGGTFLASVLAVVVGVGFGLSTVGGAEADLEGLRIGLTMALPAAYATASTMSTIRRIEGLRRYRGLVAEQKRLAAQDAARPGGPLGGPDVSTRGSKARHGEPGRYQVPHRPRREKTT